MYFSKTQKIRQVKCRFFSKTEKVCGRSQNKTADFYLISKDLHYSRFFDIFSTILQKSPFFCKISQKLLKREDA